MLEAGLVFSVPTYLFLASLGGVLFFGMAKALAMGGHRAAVVSPPPLPPATQMVTLWLLLRAFAGGCTAMTGIEAVSNGVSAFRDAAVKHARRDGDRADPGLFGRRDFLALSRHGVHAMGETQPGYQSVPSQLTGAIVGRGVTYFIAIGSLLAVLCRSANRALSIFRRLCRLVARDGYLPRAFAYPAGGWFIRLAYGG
jgi:amino acid transporter